MDAGVVVNEDADMVRLARRLMKLFALALLAVLLVLIGLTIISKSRASGDRNIRLMGARAVALELQSFLGRDLSRVVRSQGAPLDRMSAFVEQTESPFGLKNGRKPTYDFIWDGVPVSEDRVSTTMVIREREPIGGSRAVVYADAHPDLVVEISK